MAKEVPNNADGANEKEANVENILQLSEELKSAIETSSSESICAILKKANVWLDNKPATPAEFAVAVDTLLKDCSDVNFNLVNIGDVELEDEKVSISTEAQLVYANEETWEEKDLHFHLDMGVAKRGDTWEVSHFGLRPIPNKLTPIPDNTDVPNIGGIPDLNTGPGTIQTPDGDSDNYFGSSAGGMVNPLFMPESPKAPGYFDTDLKEGTLPGSGQSPYFAEGFLEEPYFAEGFLEEPYFAEGFLQEPYFSQDPEGMNTPYFGNAQFDPTRPTPTPPPPVTSKPISDQPDVNTRDKREDKEKMPKYTPVYMPVMIPTKMLKHLDC